MPNMRGIHALRVIFERQAGCYLVRDKSVNSPHHVSGCGWLSLFHIAAVLVGLKRIDGLIDDT